MQKLGFAPYQNVKNGTGSGERNVLKVMVIMSLGGLQRNIVARITDWPDMNLAFY